MDRSTSIVLCTFLLILAPRFGAAKAEVSVWRAQMDAAWEHHRSGDHQQGLAEARVALDLAESKLGPDDEGLVECLWRLAGLHLAHGDCEDGQRLVDRAAAILSGSELANPNLLTTIMRYRASSFRCKGEYDLALAVLRREVSLLDSLHGPVHPSMVSNLEYQASLLQQVGRREEAVPVLRRALAVQEALCEPDDPRLVRTLDRLALALLRGGDSMEARSLLTRSIRISETATPPRYELAAASLISLSVLQYGTRSYEQSEATALKALECLEQAPEPSPEAQAQCHDQLARIYRKTHREVEAEESERVAAEIRAGIR